MQDLEPAIKHLCSSCANVLHVLNAADTVVGNLTAGDTYIVPESSLAISAKPAYVTYRQQKKGQ